MACYFICSIGPMPEVFSSLSGIVFSTPLLNDGSESSVKKKGIGEAF